MKFLHNFRKQLLVITLLIGAGAIIPVANAFPMGKGGFGGGMAHPGEFMMDMLDLSETQETEIQAIRSQNREQNRANRESIRNLKEQFKALVDADSFDEASAAALGEQIGQLAATVSVDKARQRHQILAVLNPEQRSELQEMRGKLEARMEKRMQKRMARAWN